MPIEVRKNNILRSGEQQPFLFSATAANQHALAVAAASAHMPGGFLEQSALGENLARQRDFFSPSGIAWKILDFRCFGGVYPESRRRTQHRFWISDCRSPRRVHRLSNMADQL